jgi:hypothetical protein
MAGNASTSDPRPRGIAGWHRRVAGNISGLYYQLSKTQTGENDMKFSIISAVAATALSLSAVAAFAQSQGGTVNQPSWTNEYNPKVKAPPFAQDDLGGASSNKSSSGQYTQGAAQDLTPPSTMGKYEATEGTKAKTQ